MVFPVEGGVSGVMPQWWRNASSDEWAGYVEVEKLVALAGSSPQRHRGLPYGFSPL
jgi:hypothetical protein